MHVTTRVAVLRSCVAESLCSVGREALLPMQQQPYVDAGVGVACRLGIPGSQDLLLFFAWKHAQHSQQRYALAISVARCMDVAGVAALV